MVDDRGEEREARFARGRSGAGDEEGGAPTLRLTDPRSGRSRGLGSHLPEPGHLWIAFSPRGGRGWRGWPGPRRPWLDLTRGGRPVWSAGAERLPDRALTDLADEPLDDVLYLPPVTAEQEGTRRRLARHHARRGSPVLMQRIAGDPVGELGDAEADPVAGIHTVFDLLAPLLEGDLDPLARLPTGASAVWPLLPGLTDDPELWGAGCRRLAAAGVAAVQAVSPALRPGDRRRLAEGRDEATFQALFHRAAPPPRGFARVAWRHGLAPFLERPLPRSPLRGRVNRRVAGLLFLAAELWHRLERSAARGQELFRAGRETDRTPLDLAALAREGNLGVLTWLGPADRAFVEEALSGDRPTLLRELWETYLQDEQDEEEHGCDESG